MALRVIEIKVRIWFLSRAVHRFVYRRLGYRAWQLFSMWEELVRKSAGLPARVHEFKFYIEDEEVFRFNVGWNRRTWKLEFAV